MSNPTTNPTLVWLDSMPADERAGNDHLALRAVRLAGHRWNGFPVPIATAAEFRRFISAWARNDPNGTWCADGISEGDGALIYEDESARDVWRVVAIAADGAALYELDGWTWHAEQGWTW